ncbi:unnamed protein product, partial [Allacma fusca]
ILKAFVHDPSRAVESAKLDLREDLERTLEKLVNQSLYIFVEDGFYKMQDWQL